MAKCRSDQDCRAGRSCVQGNCEWTESCGRDLDCYDDEVCERGQCVRFDEPEPRRQDYYRREPVRYRTETHGIKGLYIAGPITFGVAYILSIAVATLDRDPKPGFSAIPFAGPWIMWARTQDEDALVLYAAFGVAQLVGTTLTLVGLLVQREVEVPVYGRNSPGGITLSVTPTFGGIAAIGRF